MASMLAFDQRNKTAEKLGTYPIKVRRVLITEGLWSSRTSIAVGELHRQGKTTAEIAEQLHMSEKMCNHISLTREACTAKRKVTVRFEVKIIGNVKKSF